MAQREKRSVSLPPELARAIDRAATEDGRTFSDWLADTAACRLRFEVGQRGIAEWEHEHGPLASEELTDGLARARSLLNRTKAKRPSRRSA